MSATASGANAQPNGSAAKSRDHNQGNQDRKYTIEQKTAVLRIRKCSPTAFYEILALEKTCSDGDIKKAYRKLSLLTHPDKNGYGGADEAFKMVSRAFQVLSDADKKSRYDQFGGDPDSRFSGSNAGAGSPFAGFPRTPGRGGFYESEISPEELFNQFFSGGFTPFGGGGMGPQFVFNMGGMGGGPFRVHQFGGQTPRRRPRNPDAQQETPQNGLAALTQLLPILLLFILPLLSSLFSSGSSQPGMRYDRPISPHTLHRVTPNYRVDYWINPSEVDGYSARQFHSLDKQAEVDYISSLRSNCEYESRIRDDEIRAAQGIFWSDEERLQRAMRMDLPGCRRLEELRVRRQY